MQQWQKCGKNPSMDTGDIAITYSIRCTDGRMDRRIDGSKDRGMQNVRPCPTQCRLKSIIDSPNNYFQLEYETETSDPPLESPSSAPVNPAPHAVSESVKYIWGFSGRLDRPDKAFILNNISSTWYWISAIVNSCNASSQRLKWGSTMRDSYNHDGHKPSRPKT